MRNRNSPELLRCLCFRIGNVSFVRRKSSRRCLMDERATNAHIHSLIQFVPPEAIHEVSANATHTPIQLVIVTARCQLFNSIRTSIQSKWFNFSCFWCPFEKYLLVYVRPMWFAADDSFSPGKSSSIRCFRWFWWNEKAEFPVTAVALHRFFPNSFSARTKSELLFFHKKILQKTELSRNVATVGGNSFFAFFFLKKRRFFYTTKTNTSQVFVMRHTLARQSNMTMSYMTSNLLTPSSERRLISPLGSLLSTDVHGRIHLIYTVTRLP